LDWGALAAASWCRQPADTNFVLKEFIFKLVAGRSLQVSDEAPT
jgi:hypothetical protein